MPKFGAVHSCKGSVNPGLEGEGRGGKAACMGSNAQPLSGESRFLGRCQVRMGHMATSTSLPLYAPLGAAPSPMGHRERVNGSDAMACVTALCCLRKRGVVWCGVVDSCLL